MRMSKIFLLTGMVFLAGGVIGAGLTYRSMKTENLMHARTGGVSVPFGEASAPASARFQPYRAGAYRLYLASRPVPGSGCVGDSLPAGLREFDGIIDVLITDPSGTIVLNRTYGPWNDPVPPATGQGWILLDSMVIDTALEQPWTNEVYGCPTTTFSPSCPWEIFLLPPQEVEIGEYLRDRMVLLVVFGGIMLLGFVMIVAGGRTRSRG